MARKKTTRKLKTKSKSKSKATAKGDLIIQVPAPQPQQIDKADVYSYQISSVIRDKKNRTTHVRVGDNLYDVVTLYNLYNNSGYRFFTSDDGVWKGDVLLVNKKSGKYYFVTEADVKKENNLDYLPLARLD